MEATEVPLVLASQSPRRREILDAAGIPHTVRVSGVDESVLPGEIPLSYVRRLARAKALAVSCSDSEIILAADTTVVAHGVILGKPESSDDARRMLRLLSGKRHDVITAVCLRSVTALHVHHDITAVWFGPLTAADIDQYVASGEPMDKAGAYAIQGLASRFVERIDGSYSNVVGLPVALVWRELTRLRSSLS